MAEPTVGQSASARPDVDIKYEIEQVVIQYPPYVNDRHYVEIDVHNGAVKITGHVKSPVTRSFLLNNLPRVAGVTRVNIDELYDDESIRIKIGQAVAPGVYIGVEHGQVIITGTLPKDANRVEMQQRVQQIPGVKRVVFNL